MRRQPFATVPCTRPTRSGEIGWRLSAMQIDGVPTTPNRRALLPSMPPMGGYGSLSCQSGAIPGPNPWWHYRCRGVSFCSCRRRVEEVTRVAWERHGVRA